MKFFIIRNDVCAFLFQNTEAPEPNIYAHISSSQRASLLVSYSSFLWLPPSLLSLSSTCLVLQSVRLPTVLCCRQVLHEFDQKPNKESQKSVQRAMLLIKIILFILYFYF